MIEPTITQNCALYFVHRNAKRRAGFFGRFRLPMTKTRGSHSTTATKSAA